MKELMQAAKMALEALEAHKIGNDHTEPISKTIQALRQALSQQEQEPVAWIDPKELNMTVSTTVTNHKQFDGDIPLYTAPPKREWVGLTVQEILEMLPSSEWKADVTLIFAKAIEAKLKEKNT